MVEMNGNTTMRCEESLGCKMASRLISVKHMIPHTGLAVLKDYSVDISPGKYLISKQG